MILCVLGTIHGDLDRFWLILGSLLFCSYPVGLSVRRLRSTHLPGSPPRCRAVHRHGVRCPALAPVLPALESVQCHTFPFFLARGFWASCVGRRAAPPPTVSESRAGSTIFFCRSLPCKTGGVAPVSSLSVSLLRDSGSGRAHQSSASSDAVRAALAFGPLAPRPSLRSQAGSAPWAPEAQVYTGRASRRCTARSLGLSLCPSIC